ncbi:MAG: hypothetical protein RRY29_10555 [Desulfovibrionaceae bacterium]
MSQTTEGATSGLSASGAEGTVEAMLHNHQQAVSQGPCATGNSLAAAKAGPAAGVHSDTGPGSLLHKNLEAAVETASDSAATASPAAVPEQYALTIPQSLSGSVTPEQIAGFENYAKSAGLSNEQAQAALDFKVHLTREFQETQQQLLTQWEEQVRADPALGGRNLTTTVATATRAMQHYDPTGTISKLLCSSGHGSNPDVVRFLYNIGKAMGEDKVPFTGNARQAELPLAERMYPHFKFD